jgi:AcrR family transcriptional regulator
VESQDDLWPPWAAPQGQRHVERRRAAEERMGGPPRGRGRQGGTRPGAARQGTARQGTALSREEIVDAAIAVADAEGPDAVSMRRIAQVLRSGTMSLYWHVANKEHLLNLMIDALIAEIEVPGPSGDWRADLRGYAMSSHASLLRHPWAIDFLGRTTLGPNMLRTVDRSLAVLDGLNLDAATAMTVLQALTTYVSGTVLREFQELRDQREQEASGIAEDEMRADVTAWQARLKQAGGFEHFVGIFEQNVDPDAAETRLERFEFGLDCLLEGIAVRVGERGERVRS